MAKMNKWDRAVERGECTVESVMYGLGDSHLIMPLPEHEKGDEGDE